MTLTPPTQDPSTLNSQPATNPPPSTNLHRKIAKLPRPLRDLINTMLDDAASGPEILARLKESTNPPLPYPISEQNISDWRRTGYQDYLRQQQWQADSRFLLE